MIFVLTLFAFMISAVVPSAHHPGAPATDLEKCWLKGHVRSMQETRMSPVGDGSQQGEVTYKKLSKFNPEGFEEETIIYNNNGKSSKVFYLFDTAAYPIGLREYTEEGNLWLTVSYKLDEKGNKLEAYFDWEAKGGYDEIREKSEQLYELLDRNPWDRVVYANDYRGFPREERYLKEDGMELFKFTYKYDIHGNRTEMTYFNSKGRTSWEIKYKYDREYRMISSTIYKSNRVAARSEYTYTFDSNGNWTRRLEKREVVHNILTAHLEEGNFVTERVMEYYPE